MNRNKSFCVRQISVGHPVHKYIVEAPSVYGPLPPPRPRLALSVIQFRGSLAASIRASLRVHRYIIYNTCIHRWWREEPRGERFGTVFRMSIRYYEKTDCGTDARSKQNV